MKPNILLIVSDEERRNDWLGGKVPLPAHDRLRADGLSFNRYYTHSSPCSPSRASLYTGQYLADHGVVDNVSFPTHTALNSEIPTVGSLLSQAGYRSSYLGKWHLSHDSEPDMPAYGYSDWQGSDRHFTGGPWSGRKFDPVIAQQAIDWLHQHGNGETPWFLTVALVNPHDIMWYPIDHLSYQQQNPKDAEAFQFMIDVILKGVELTAPPEDYPQLFDSLPENFEDDLHTKPEIQRAWRTVRNHEHFVGSLSLEDHHYWLRQLDYYAWLHERLEESLQGILGCLDELGIYDDTTILYTSDHGDACGSHGLRAKLPCVYEEVMGVPLIIKPGRSLAADSSSSAADFLGADSPGANSSSSAANSPTGNSPAANSPTANSPSAKNTGPGFAFAGHQTEALATHVDLAATICSMGGLNLGDIPSLAGKDLSPVLGDPATKIRDWVFFSQDSAQSELLSNCRYAVRGFFDGTTKYARYYGIGGGIRRDGKPDKAGKRFDVDADFDDHDHEWYDLTEDPHELQNKAHLRSERNKLRELFGQLLEIEAAELNSATFNTPPSTAQP